MGGKKVHTETDVRIGAKVREMRVLRNWSQEQLGEKLGLTFQQIQKYERGANKLSAVRLLQISNAFDVPLSYFLQDEQQGTGEPMPDIQRWELETMADLRRVPKLHLQKLRDLIRSLAGPVAGRPRRGRPPGTGKRQQEAREQAGL